MARIVVTSDVHYDDEVDLTSPATVDALVTEIEGLAPTAVIIAGDLGHPLRNFQGCLSLFARLPCPVGVVAGNHDIWRDPEGKASSAHLFHELLPTTVRSLGAAWLEQDAIIVGRTAIIGSLAWYDYSAVDPALELTREQLGDLKQHATNDSVWVDLPWSDEVFAGQLRRSIVDRLDALDWDPDIDRVILTTHVPLFLEQMVARTDAASWGLLKAYFGNLTTGEAVLRFPKLSTLVSGHTHRRVEHQSVERPGAPPIGLHAVGSDYGTPAITVLDFDDDDDENRCLRGVIRLAGPPWTE